VTQLYFLDATTRLIDSPGIRQLAMEHFSLQDLLKGFPDFQEAGCRFKDCDHVDSKGCLLQQALAEGIIPSHRYADYLYLRKKFLAPAGHW
jgi:ribosome biogenesis GTPase